MLRRPDQIGCFLWYCQMYITYLWCRYKILVCTAVIVGSVFVSLSWWSKSRVPFSTSVLLFCIMGGATLTVKGERLIGVFEVMCYCNNVNTIREISRFPFLRNIHVIQVDVLKYCTFSVSWICNLSRCLISVRLMLICNNSAIISARNGIVP